MKHFLLDGVFANEYIERINFLVTESFTNDMQKLLYMDFNQASISNSCVISDYTYSLPIKMATRTNFGLIKFSDNQSNIKFGYYKDFEDKSNLSIKLFSRVFNDKENYVESASGQINLNNQFDRLNVIAKREINFYKIESDRYASNTVNELSKFFPSSNLTLYKMLTEKDGGYEHCYIVRGASFTARKGNLKHLFWFKEPLDIKNDEMFLNSIKDTINENFKLGIEEVKSSEVYEYLEMLKIIDY